MMIFWYLLMSVSSCCWGPPVWFWEEPLSLFSYYSSSLVVLVQVLTSCGRWDLPGGEKKKRREEKLSLASHRYRRLIFLPFMWPLLLRIPLPSLVLALRSGGAGAWGGSAGGGCAAAGGVTSATMVSTAAGTLAVARAALAAAAPLRGLLVLNSRHFAPRTIIILDTAIFGFLAAMRGLRRVSGNKIKNGYEFI